MYVQWNEYGKSLTMIKKHRGGVMGYITVREMAEKWKISERLVQKYCAQGRIPGARKFGLSWGIPEDARKPKDPRKEKKRIKTKCKEKQPLLFIDLMPLMNTPFEPGYCTEYIQEMQDGPKKEIAIAEYYYFSGHPKEAVQKAELYLDSPDMTQRLSACLIYAYANLSIGQIYRARYALSAVKKILLKNNVDIPVEYRAAEAFIASAAAVLLHLPLPENIPSVKEYLYLLPPGLQAFSLYIQAHYSYLQGDYEKGIGIAEAILDLQAERYPIPSIYLHLVTVMNYMSLKQKEKARQHLLAAWEIARPDDLIEAFGEHHGLLGGMLESVIKKDWPEDFKRIIDITYRFSSGWRKIHNPITGDDIADNLTTTEFAIAMLAARGWTNQEIAEHMKISQNTVKRHISSALQKLHIERRKDLKQYMLQ